MVEAYAWFQLAASADYDQAKLNSSIVEANLDSAEMQKAKERAKQYLTNYPPVKE